MSIAEKRVLREEMFDIRLRFREVRVRVRFRERDERIRFRERDERVRFRHHYERTRPLPIRVTISALYVTSQQNL